MNDEGKNKLQLISELDAMRQRMAQLEDRKSAQWGETLEESEEKYHALLANMLDAYAYHKILLDEKNKPVDYIFLEVNEHFVDFTGIRKENIIGKKVTEVFPGV